MSTSAYCWSSTEICAFRVLRLDATGALVTDSSNGYVSGSIVEFSVRRNIDRGDQKTYKSATNCICAYKRNQDRLLNLEFTMKLCPLLDPELNEILGGDSVITSGGKSIGGASEDVIGTCTSCSTTATPDGTVSVELYTKAWASNRQASLSGANQFWRWVFPRVQWTMGDLSFNNEIMQLDFTGYSIENPSWGTGPTSDPTSTAVTRPYHYELTDALPTITCGYATVT